MRNTLWNKIGRASSTTKGNRSRSRRLSVEDLESRVVPFVTASDWGSHFISFSYSNLLDGQIRNDAGVALSTGDLTTATREAMGAWAAVADIAFYQVADAGPMPSETDYDYTGMPTIRWGHHFIDGEPEDESGSVLAHARTPGTGGLDGDVHFDTGEGFTVNEFLQVATHELGHAVGMEHPNGDVVGDVDPPPFPAIMHAIIGGGTPSTWSFNGLGSAYLLQDDIDGIRSLYGLGLGYVLDSNGIMHVYGTRDNDSFSVTTSGSNIIVTNGWTRGTVNRPMAGIRGIALYGLDGDDGFRVVRSNGLPVTINGNAGNDSALIQWNAAAQVSFSGGTQPAGGLGDRVRVDMPDVSATLTSTSYLFGSTNVLYNADGTTELMEVTGNNRGTLTVLGTSAVASRVADVQTVNIAAAANAVNLVRPLFVNIGSGGRTGGVTGNVTLERGTFVELNVDDSASTTARGFILGNSELSGLPGRVRWGNDVRFNGFKVSGGSGGNDFLVLGSPNTLVKLNTGTGADRVQVAGTSRALEIHGQDGADDVQIGFNGSVQALRGNVTVTNANNYSAVSIDSAADTANRTLIVYRQTGVPNHIVSGLTPHADILVGSEDVRSLAIGMGSGTNTVRVHDTPLGNPAESTTTTIRTGNGLADVTVNGTTGQLTVDLQEGFGEVVRVGSASTGMDRIQGYVNLTGGTGFNSVLLNDSPSRAGQIRTHTVTPTTYFRSGGTAVNLGAVHSLELRTGAATDTVDVQGNPLAPAPIGAFEISSGGGDDTINVGSATRRLAGIGTLFVDGGASTNGDRINFVDDGSSDATTYDLDLDFGNVATPVFTSRDATVHYRNVEVVNLLGGSANDEIRVRDLPRSTVTVLPGAGDDTVDIGSTANRIGAMSLTVNDSAGSDQVILRDQGQTTARAYVRDIGPHLTAQPRTGAGPRANFTFLGVESASLSAGSGNDSFRITQSKQYPLALYGGTGNDVFNVGSTAFYDIFTDTTYPANMLKFITSPVTMDGQEGQDQLSFNDQGTTTGQTYTITNSTLQRPDTALMTHANMEQVTINGSAGDDTFRMAQPDGSPYAPAQSVNGNSGINTLDYSAFSGVPTSEPPPRSNWYKADGDFNDSAGTINGTPNGGVSFAPGQVGQAFNFDGIDDYISLGIDASLDLPGSQSVGMWLNYRPYSANGYKYLFADFAPGGITSQGSIGIEGGQLFFYQSFTDGSSLQTKGVTNMVPDQWYHVAVVRDDAAKTVKLYVNGVEDASDNYTGSPVELQGEKLIGTSLPVDFPQDFLDGRLDDVSVFNHALTAEEIASLAGADSGGGVDVTVNLRLGTATGLADGVARIQNVVGGAGNDILVGTGVNVLTGGLGRDLLISGARAGSLVGGGDDDILIAGTTIYDTNRTSLEAIRTAWTSGDDYATRVATLRAGLLANGSITRNVPPNSLRGEAGLDLFFASVGDTGDWTDEESVFF